MKELIVILLCTVKFGLTFPLAIMQFHFGFFETILWTNVGGILGIYFFGYLSKQLIVLWKKIFSRTPVSHSEKNPPPGTHKKKRVFTRRNRRIVYIKTRYGLPGIALATPILLSIPVGVFLVVRYFNRKKYKFVYMIVANFIWSLIYATFMGSLTTCSKRYSPAYNCLTIE